MKKLTAIVIALLLGFGAHAQNLEVVGKAKITEMDTITSAQDTTAGNVVRLADISSGIQWYNGTNKVTNARGDGVGAGEMNTMLIIAQQTADNTAGNFVALICAKLVRGGYGDWYLPSKEELNLMYTNLYLAGLGGFPGTVFWNSTENDSITAWIQAFNDGVQGLSNKSNVSDVRAVRAF